MISVNLFIFYWLSNLSIQMENRQTRKHDGACSVCVNVCAVESE